MPNSAYRLGVFIRRNIWQIICLTSFVVIGAWWSKSDPAALTKEKKDEAVADADSGRANCRLGIADIRERYKKQFADGKFGEAAHTIGNCARLLGDAELLALQRNAAVKFHLAAVNATGLSPGARADAIEAFAADFPEESTSLTTEVFALRSRQTDLDVAAEKSRRRQEGVRIGMTAEEVRDSSWGVPAKVNRTTTAHGVREQWIYSGGYLYLDDGKLTAIQN